MTKQDVSLTRSRAWLFMVSIYGAGVFDRLHAERRHSLRENDYLPLRTAIARLTKRLRAWRRDQWVPF